MAAFLHKTPESKADADNSLEMVTLMLNDQAIAIADRFRFNYVSGFNMSEVAVPLLTGINLSLIHI